MIIDFIAYFYTVLVVYLLELLIFLYLHVNSLYSPRSFIWNIIVDLIIWTSTWSLVIPLVLHQNSIYPKPIVTSDTQFYPLYLNLWSVLAWNLYTLLCVYNPYLNSCDKIDHITAPSALMTYLLWICLPNDLHSNSNIPLTPLTYWHTILC